MTVKVGDKVRVTTDVWEPDVARGAVGTVVHTHKNGNISVTVNSGDGFDWYLNEKEYELVLQTGTLQELSVKPGDVVECVDDFCGNYSDGKLYTINRNGYTIQDSGVEQNGVASKFRIVSRASDNTPKLWRDMAEAEKGELLLAHHRGEVIEYWNGMYWVPPLDGLPSWFPVDAYRIKPDEPVRETVTLTGFHRSTLGYCITFDAINGTPDPATIKMERI